METATPVLAYASGARRLLSLFIDYFAIQILAVPFVGSTSQRVAEAITEGKTLAANDVARLSVVTVLVIVVYFTAMHTWRGVTFGKMATRTVVVNLDGSAISPSTAFVRSVAQAAIFFAAPFAFFVPLVLNELRPFWNRRRQTFHDSIAHTVVVRADSVTEPFDGPT